MSFEEAKVIGTSLNTIYPTDTFLVSPPSAITSGKGSVIIGKPHSMRIFKLAQSSEEMKFDSVKSLTYLSVFGTRTTPLAERPEKIVASIKQVLPSVIPNVAVLPKSEPEVPTVFGPNKGTAYFSEEEFGDHVFIVLT